jgi:hypothetical protein
VQRLLRDQYDFEARRKIVATEEGFSRRHWASFADLGLFAAPFAEDVGGLGGGPLSTMIVMQEFGRHLVVEPFFETVVLAGGLIADAGWPIRKRRIFRKSFPATRSGHWPGPRAAHATISPALRRLPAATATIMCSAAPRQPSWPHPGPTSWSFRRAPPGTSATGVA